VETTLLDLEQLVSFHSNKFNENLCEREKEREREREKREEQEKINER
jgi:hypothetical protein